MNRISLFSIAIAFAGIAAASPASAERPVMHGAMDICEAVDGGEVSVHDGIEACCAQEVTEYDDGYIDFGEKYCVACVEGTDDCTYYEDAWRRSPKEQIKALSKIKAQQRAPLTRN